ncbi:MSCRAMM family protein [Micrococcoides hystricis]|uniref:SpaA isopeptide-forming pilin-related protein n=1 Tax=Micrococcoides hystricis TaxID=1572761 RepID=A0ABV6P9I4_9MICC
MAAPIVAGAIDPTNGNFLFGTFVQSSSGGAARFELYRFDVENRTFRHLGDVSGLPNQNNSALNNGDMAFDSNGNLYIVRHNAISSSSGTGTVSIITVPKASLDAARTSPNPIQLDWTSSPPRSWQDPLPPSTTVQGAINGIAFASNGTIYVGKGRQIVAIDAQTAATVGAPITGNLFSGRNSSTDLASCGSPPTLTLRKSVTSRLNPEDQFQLRLKTNDGTVISTNTTAGTAQGLQEQMVGPVPVHGGGTFQFDELITTDAEYSGTWRCTGPGLDTSGTGEAGSVTIPATAQGGTANFVCTITNAPATGTPRAVKVDATNPTITLDGARFQLWKDVNGDGALQPGTDTRVGGELTTGANGVVQWPNTTVGKYLIQEVTPPNGYTLSSPAVSAVTVTKNAVIERRFQNPRIKGSITFSKVDADTQSLLSGSRWTLQGPGIGGPTVTIQDCTAEPCNGPDKNPAAGQFRINDLAWGEYVLTETHSPTGYDGLAEPVRFTIGQNNVVNASNTPTPIALGAQANTKKRGKISWRKVNDEQQPLAGSEWRLRGPGTDGPTVAVTDCTAAPCSGADKDPAAASFRVENLTWGNYVLEETKAPTGYTLNTTPRTITINRDNVADTIQVGDIVNERILGTVTWSKTDAADPGTPLGGSEWTLTGPGLPAAGKTITDCIAETAAACTGDDKDPAAGEFKLEALAWGDYQLTEATAPAGYLRDDTVHTFTISATNLNHAFADPFTNEQREGPALPLTGGVGTHIFLITGAAGITATLAIAYWRRRNNTRLEADATQ